MDGAEPTPLTVGDLSAAGTDTIAFLMSEGTAPDELFARQGGEERCHGFDGPGVSVPVPGSGLKIVHRKEESPCRPVPP